jgi:hypothetical protein
MARPAPSATREASVRLSRCRVHAGRGGPVTAWQDVGPFDDLVASWAAPGDGDCSVEVQCRVAGRETAWYPLASRRGGVWSSHPGKEDADARIEVDILRARRPLEGFRLRIVGVPTVRDVRLAAVTALRPFPPSRALGRPVAARALEVEPLSQMAFAGVDPDIDGGGASWCSPTALAMVLRYHGVEVDVRAVARAVYDPLYGGCGNWSLNVAFAAALGLDAFVTRLRGLADAAALLDAGVPIVASIVASPGALPGFPLEGGTKGHLVVVAGLTADGDPVVFDPAAPDTASVRRIYPQAAFLEAWVGGAGGIAYVVRPHGLELPAGDGLW